MTNLQTFFCFPPARRLTQKSSQPQPDSDKKRESRMSGLFNRIKPRSSKSEKSHVALLVPTIPQHTPVTSPTTTPQPPAPSPDPEEPTHPRPLVKTPVLAPMPEAVKVITPSDPEPPVEPVTSDPKEEPHVDMKSKHSPLIGHHKGVQVMGNDFLAEMRAKQERMAAASVKVSRLHWMLIILFNTTLSLYI